MFFFKSFPAFVQICSAYEQWTLNSMCLACFCSVISFLSRKPFIRRHNC